MKQNEITREDGTLTIKKHEALKEQAGAIGDAPTSSAPVVEGLDSRIESALRAASDKKALEMVVLDLRAIANFTDYFLITSGTNVRQVQAIADAITERLKQEGTRAERIEGYHTAEWVLVDYGDLIVHIFEEKARRFYDLERLWRDATRVKLPADLRAEAGGSVRSA